MKQRYPHPAASAFSNLKNILLDALFPVCCLSCRKENFWLCENCLKSIEILEFQVCPACENAVTDKGLLCLSCRNSGRMSLDALLQALPYDNPTVKKLIHIFKYRFVRDIADPLAAFLGSALLRNDFPVPDFLVPVPLHPRRLRWRGFNQSLLLAEKISESLAPPMKIEILDILQRKKYREPQMKVKKYQERLQNVQGIFDVDPDSDFAKIEKKSLLLIDDIATTGATLEECAKALKAAGARKVYAAVVSRQTLKK